MQTIGMAGYRVQARSIAFKSDIKSAFKLGIKPTKEQDIEAGGINLVNSSDYKRKRKIASVFALMLSGITLINSNLLHLNFSAPKPAEIKPEPVQAAASDDNIEDRIKKETDKKTKQALNPYKQEQLDLLIDELMMQKEARLQPPAAVYPLIKDYGEEMVTLAKNFEGYSEGEFEKETGYELPDNLWCAAFLKYISSEVMKEKLPSWYAESGYNRVKDVLYAADKEGLTFENYTQAKVGDLAVITTKRGENSHIGMVIDINKKEGLVTTIEGNAGEGKVDINKYDMNKETPKITQFIKFATVAG